MEIVVATGLMTATRWSDLRHSLSFVLQIENTGNRNALLASILCRRRGGRRMLLKDRLADTGVGLSRWCRAAVKRFSTDFIVALSLMAKWRSARATAKSLSGLTE